MSIPNLANEIDTASTQKTIVVDIYKRIKLYLGDTPPSDKFYDLKYTVIRQYLHNLLLTLKNAGIEPKFIMQLKTILNSRIINDMEYSLKIRIGKFLVHLNNFCVINMNATALISEYDANVLYF